MIHTISVQPMYSKLKQCARNSEAMAGGSKASFRRLDNNKLHACLYREKHKFKCSSIHC